VHRDGLIAVAAELEHEPDVAIRARQRAAVRRHADDASIAQDLGT